MEYGLILVILYWIGVGIYRFFRWLARSVTGANAAPFPIQQAREEAQRQASQQRQMPPRVPPPSARPWEMPQQPGAGGPAVYQEATERDFERQETELLTEEPVPFAAPLRSTATPAPAAPFRLFQTNNDLVRAIILQEALGPPLSRRGHASK